MAWTPPTIVEFDTAFPEFADLPNGKVEYELAQAIAEVSRGSWIDRDRAPAVLHLTAHRLSALGSGVSGGSGGAGTPAGAVLSAREVGDVRSEFKYGLNAPGTVNYADLKTSSYGQRFLELKRLNFPSIRVV